MHTDNDLHVRLRMCLDEYSYFRCSNKCEVLKCKLYLYTHL